MLHIVHILSMDCCGVAYLSLILQTQQVKEEIVINCTAFTFFGDQTAYDLKPSSETTEVHSLSPFILNAIEHVFQSVFFINPHQIKVIV